MPSEEEATENENEKAAENNATDTNSQSLNILRGMLIAAIVIFILLITTWIYMSIRSR